MDIRESSSALRRILTAALAVVAAGQLWAAPAVAELRNGEPGAQAACDRIEGDLAEAIDEAGVPGATVAVVTPESVDVRAVGEDAAGEALEPDAAMLWGSVSKPIAATVVMRLVEEGRLALDDPVSEYLQEMPATDPRLRSVTIRQLLTHTSGLPFGAEFLDVDAPGRRASDVIAAMEDLELVGDPGGAYSYSSVGFVFVQAVIEEVEGEGLAEVESRLFPGVGELDDVSPGARFVGNRALSWRTPRDGAGLGYGYQGGSVGALAGFVQDSFGEGGAGGIDEMIEEPVDSGGGGSMGLGWRVRGDGVVWHTGTVPGYFSAVHIDRERQVAVVVTMNASGLLHEEQLLGITEGLFEEVRGNEGDGGDFGSSPVGLLILLGVAVVVLVVVGLGIRLRGGRVRAAFWLVGSLGVGLCGWWLLPALLEVPARYLWLWVPEVAIAFTLIPIALFGVGVWSAFRSRERGRPRARTGRGQQRRGAVGSGSAHP
ncbi:MULTISPECIES: serine hydrolase domain-containing protein [unclassified Brevibacterium]|uniref:serine hydrolase domain-containing protein n=1 Tax=unclassified Brevibacterium TaxID=2614124 RepID=UPI001E595962|nr:MULTISPECIES: serine hydrolase domain-containing protein [unclassified Brevibacterium]MCD1287357.1 hypothetical protein [Brevibacterium sp. CCUG 69071]MDK8436849.1 serine hydrolase domain-containing protein [Brevibacterium sp. H-BE7]